ncbi:MAG: nucleotide sugar dehydrogenase [Gammaproteobacteria bacterium]|nr:nucleotide sugar dehydrogenase [Gammaproteobacteria bacterium]
MFDPAKTRIGVIGLGYVGLPLAAAFAAEFPTTGFDIDKTRIAELGQGLDRTREVDGEELAAAKRLRYTADPEELRDVNFYVVTVPTPLDGHKAPDLTPLRKASESVGKVIGAGDVVVFESTVYPGVTEEVCVPIIEKLSGLACNRDFFAGYSPERINPGDREHRVRDILKVTSGSTPETAEYVDAVYGKVIRAGTYRASSIRVAEAAKVIENTQRDVNIALINELAILFERLGLDTREVLEAAGTKWNFLPFRPGLVGGHCIGVDPYYLTHKAIEVGHHPEMILAGRRINDGMGAYVADRVVKLMIHKRISISGARVMVLGLAFKENCPDLRNTHVVDIISQFKTYGVEADVWDPWVDADQARREYGLQLVAAPPQGAYDAVVLAVAHREFTDLGAAGIRALGKPDCIVYDVKGVLPRDACDESL